MTFSSVSHQKKTVLITLFKSGGLMDFGAPHAATHQRTLLKDIAGFSAHCAVIKHRLLPEQYFTACGIRF